MLSAERSLRTFAVCSPFLHCGCTQLPQLAVTNAKRHFGVIESNILADSSCGRRALIGTPNHTQFSFLAAYSADGHMCVHHMSRYGTAPSRVQKRTFASPFSTLACLISLLRISFIRSCFQALLHHNVDVPKFAILAGARTCRLRRGHCNMPAPAVLLLLGS